MWTVCSQVKESCKLTTPGTWEYQSWRCCLWLPELWVGISAGTELFLPYQQPYDEHFLLGIQGGPPRPHEEEENYEVYWGESHSPLVSNSTILTCKMNHPVCGSITLDPESHVHFFFSSWVMRVDVFEQGASHFLIHVRYCLLVLCLVPYKREGSCLWPCCSPRCPQAAHGVLWLHGRHLGGCAFGSLLSGNHLLLCWHLSKTEGGQSMTKLPQLWAKYIKIPCPEWHWVEKTRENWGKWAVQSAAEERGKPW